MKIKVVELFAGVGGFRLGLEGWEGKSPSSSYEENIDSNFEVVWSNQWEPSTKTIQHANLVYTSRWPKSNHSNENIEDVIANKFDVIPNHDLLVGGFPCQDYSVATTLKNSKGLKGKKGVLWWSIYEIISRRKPKYLILENVDRLLVSPANQPGRDFAVMLSCFFELGYAVEWRVINSAEYGMPQRRRRIFIVAYHKNSKVYKRFENHNPSDIITHLGILSKSFEVNIPNDLFHGLIEGKIKKNKAKVSSDFNRNKNKNPFQNSGYMINGQYYTAKLIPKYNGEKLNLGDIVETNNDMIPQEFFISDEKLKTPKIKYQINGDIIRIETEKQMWEYLKGAKKEYKVNKQLKYKYQYAEGSMVFPDCLDKPSRTIITGEGGKSPSRFKHVICSNPKQGILRRLTPEELEGLNMFPKGHTRHELINNTKRAFLMGNALVVGIVEKIGKSLIKEIMS